MFQVEHACPADALNTLDPCCVFTLSAGVQAYRSYQKSSSCSVSDQGNICHIVRQDRHCSLNHRYGFWLKLCKHSGKLQTTRKRLVNHRLQSLGDAAKPLGGNHSGELCNHTGKLRDRVGDTSMSRRPERGNTQKPAELAVDLR